jgi:hypothetical protein
MRLDDYGVIGDMCAINRPPVPNGKLQANPAASESRAAQPFDYVWALSH